MKTKDVLVALAAIAQESRLAVFRLLVQAGPDGMAASKIGEQLDIAPSPRVTPWSAASEAAAAASIPSGMVCFEAK